MYVYDEQSTIKLNTQCCQKNEIFLTVYGVIKQNNTFSRISIEFRRISDEFQNKQS